MEENKKKVSVSTVLLIIAIIIIVIQAIFNYQFCSEKKIAEEKVESLNNQIANLEGNVGSYRDTLDEIANLVNSALNSSVDENVEVQSGETEGVSGEEVTESGEENTDITENTENTEIENTESEEETETNEVV